MIVSISLISNEDTNKFAIDLCEKIKEFQALNYEVDIKYNVDNYNHSALILARDLKGEQLI